MEPVAASQLLEFVRCALERAAERLIGPKHQRHRSRQRKGLLLRDIGERRVGVQSQHRADALVADVVRADREIRHRFAVRLCGPYANRDSRQSGERGDAPPEWRRMESSLVAMESRGEMGDSQAPAMFVLEFSLED